MWERKKDKGCRFRDVNFLVVCQKVGVVPAALRTQKAAIEEKSYYSGTLESLY